MSKNLSAKYYQENNERLKEKACERYQNLSKEEKEKKRQHGRECYKNLSEDEKQNLFSFFNILWNEKNCLIIIIKNICFEK